jgi:AmmeMemoRadiSam system protein A
VTAPPFLTPDEGRVLLAHARAAILARLESLAAPFLVDLPSRLLVPQAAFVTLHLGARLRGCIGSLAPLRPLAETVAGCAAAAAMEDPRFPPLGPREMPGIRIEISALDPPFRVRDSSQIVLGQHGLLVTHGGRHGLLLPQVARQEGWSLRTFLEATCLKAGLPPDAWERGAVLEAFGAQVIAEGAPTR